MVKIPVQSRIHPDQLNKHPVEFTFPAEQGQVTGWGRFEAARNSNGFDYVDIIVIEPISDVDQIMRYPLSQELVNLIQARDDADGFMLAVPVR